MRKHVKPAHPNATIPDPERRGDLPAEGRVVTWSVHWARLAAREDVVVTELPEAAEPPKDPPATEGEGSSAEGVAASAEGGEPPVPPSDPEAAPHADA